LILIKLLGRTRVWTLEKGIVAIYIERLTKHKKWLLVLVCLLKLTKVIHIVVITIYHHVPQNGYWFLEVNINKLLLKWMPCDLMLVGQT
jgi:hypothetical protein